MLNLVSYTNSISKFPRIEALNTNSSEDVLNLIKSLRDERSEDIQDRAIDDLRKKEQISNKDNPINKQSHWGTGSKQRKAKCDQFNENTLI